MADGTVLVLGGSGFVGRHLVDGPRARTAIASSFRRAAASDARHLILLPTVDVVDADIHDPPHARAARQGRVRRRQPRRHPERGGSRHVRARARRARRARSIAACRAAGVRRLLHMSALERRSGRPERGICAARAKPRRWSIGSGLDWTIFRPSVIFGREDRFLNLFAPLLRHAAGDGARRARRAVPAGLRAAMSRSASSTRSATTRRSGSGIRCAGPTVYTLRELVRFVGKLTGVRAPDRGARADARRGCRRRLLELLPGTLMSRDNLASMAEGQRLRLRVSAGIRHRAHIARAIAPTYLGPARRA